MKIKSDSAEYIPTLNHLVFARVDESGELDIRHNIFYFALQSYTGGEAGVSGMYLVLQVDLRRLTSLYGKRTKKRTSYLDRADVLVLRALLALHHGGPTIVSHLHVDGGRREDRLPTAVLRVSDIVEHTQGAITVVEETPGSLAGQPQWANVLSYKDASVLEDRFIRSVAQLSNVDPATVAKVFMGATTTIIDVASQALSTGVELATFALFPLGTLSIGYGPHGIESYFHVHSLVSRSVAESVGEDTSERLLTEALQRDISVRWRSNEVLAHCVSRHRIWQAEERYKLSVDRAEIERLRTQNELTLQFLQSQALAAVLTKLEGEIAEICRDLAPSDDIRMSDVKCSKDIHTVWAEAMASAERALDVISARRDELFKRSDVLSNIMKQTGVGGSSGEKGNEGIESSVDSGQDA